LRLGAVEKQDFSVILAIKNGFNLSHPKLENLPAVTAHLVKALVALA